MNTFGFEDDNNPPKLTIELVPSTSWGNNLRSRLTKERWDELRKHCYRNANYRCEICGQQGTSQGAGWPVEAHEIWSYDDKKHIQTFVRTIALCSYCHKVKHFGRTQAVGEEDLAIKHLMVVNSWTKTQALAYVKDAFRIWERRSQYPWTLDISKILV